jgi:predicted transcriptional regulator of viral defense system
LYPVTGRVGGTVPAFELPEAGGGIQEGSCLDVGMRRQSRTVQGRIANLAGRQKGLVHRRQLLSLGLSRSAIDRRVRTGVLLPEFPGVYSVGHRSTSIAARNMAAVIACGVGSVVYARSAGHAHGLLRQPPPRPQVMTRSERRIRGIDTRRTRSLKPVDTTTVHRIPVTTVARTLVDLAAELTEDELASACHEAGVRHRTTPRQVAEALERFPTAPGAATLRRILSGEVRVTLSALERRFLASLREVGLPLPETNKPAGGRRVDCRWPEHRLTVELDSYRYHGTRLAWERDRRREREAYARGDEFRRYTYGDVFNRPGQMLTELQGLLGKRPG